MGLTLNEAVRAADRQLHPITLQEASAASRSTALREELDWSVRHATRDLNFATDYRSHMPHEGTTPKDYLNRWVAVAPDLEVLLGPRHRARDLSRPFVAVDAASRRIRPDDLPALRAASKAAFHQFTPLSVVFWDHGTPNDWPGTNPDMRLLAGQGGHLRTRPMPPGLQIELASDMSFYDRYRAGYLKLLHDHPEANEWTQPAELDTLDELRQQNLVLEARVDGHWAGLIAGEPDARAGLRGISVNTIFLLPKFRHRKLGSALSIALAHATPIPDSEYIHGTIHWNNTAARHAAIAAGRQYRGGEAVVPLTEQRA